MTTDEWARRINRLVAEIDDIAQPIHPSVWPYQLSHHHRRYEKLAKAETHDPPQQLELDLWNKKDH